MRPIRPTGRETRSARRPPKARADPLRGAAAAVHRDAVAVAGRGPALAVKTPLRSATRYRPPRPARRTTLPGRRRLPPRRRATRRAVAVGADADVGGGAGAAEST